MTECQPLINFLWAAVKIPAVGGDPTCLHDEAGLPFTMTTYLYCYMHKTILLAQLGGLRDFKPTDVHQSRRN